ncbi:MAG: cupredoxin domain-containing protein [Actinobacteria bacterium]|nr:cupredoxin domain-containing protein [Actinomycetota bacterium]
MVGLPNKAAALSLAFAVALAVGACGDSDDGAGAGAPSDSTSGSGDHAHNETTTLSTFPPAEAETTVAVTMRDFRFEMPTTVAAGKVLFNVTNEGPTEHEFVVFQGSKQVAHLDSQDRNESGRLAVVLPAGRYTIKCLIGSGGARHDKLGMVQNITVE